MHHYLGVDIGGKNNTWMAAITEEEGKKPTVQIRNATLQEIITECQSKNVMALAIDAQLTFSVSRENGFRAGDEELKSMLPPGVGEIVMSYNSLMAVPLRGAALAAAVSPFVGTVIETHPRACLVLGDVGGAVRNEERIYKKTKTVAERTAARQACIRLWDWWVGEFGLRANQEPAQHKGNIDDIVDATVTATVAWLYHRHPERLQKLGPGPTDETGRGPFWVVRQRLAS